MKVNKMLCLGVNYVAFKRGRTTSERSIPDGHDTMGFRWTSGLVVVYSLTHLE